ncbi:MAG: 1-acyl-sn-glycerol-3-phosphate acyltransferase [Rhodospirillales bacterium]
MTAVDLTGSTILVTGVTGQVAAPLAVSLARQATVIGAARFSNPTKRTELEAAGVSCVTIDLEKGEVTDLPGDIDYVLNFAVAKTNDWDRDLDAHAGGVLSLMEQVADVSGVLGGGYVALPVLLYAHDTGVPVVGTIARLGRSVFVTRQRGSTVRERDTMQGLLAGGDNLILFPEGTSSDGSRVLPFRSSFFSVAQSEARPIIQPVSVVYDRLGGLPAGRANRPVFAWYGDMDIASHSWRLARFSGLRVTVLLHAPMDPARFPDRKMLSHAVWRTVADGAATLRQNRPARPLEVAEAPGVDSMGAGNEAFA